MIAHGCHLCRAIICQPLPGYFGGLSQANDPRQILRAGAALALMIAAIEQRLDQSSLLDEERAGSLRSVDLMPGNGERIAANFLHIHRHLAGGLNGVSMEE